MNKIKNIFFKIITTLGGFPFYVILVALLFLFDQNNLSYKLIISFIFVMAISVSIKFFYFTDRPIKMPSQNVIQKLYASSFPSIHAMRILSLAFWIAIFFNNKITITLSIIFVLLVCYSRVYLKKHFWIDVIFGIIFSFIINYAIWYFI